MKRRISFGEIGQYRTAVRSVTDRTRFTGKDKNGEATFSNTVKMPVIRCTATEKIHGTNGAVSFSNPDGFWVNSKKKILTPSEDNAGCALIAHANEKEWMTIIRDLACEYNIDLDKNVITIFFEWAGGKIQPKSACTGLSKQAIIFQHFKISPLEPIIADDGQELKAVWRETCITHEGLQTALDYRSAGIYNICSGKTWHFDIDFEYPQLHSNMMLDIVMKEVEPESPYGLAKGQSENVGEGIVVTFLLGDDLIRFKIKGEKHSKSKVKKLKEVDEEKELAKINLVNIVVNASRLEQAWQETFGIENEKCAPDISKTGDFIRAVIKDVMKEELDLYVEAEIEPKDLNQMISKQARIWFMEQLDEEYMK